MFKSSKEKMVLSIFENLITQSKAQMKDEIAAVIKNHGIINEQDLYALYDSFYGAYYKSVDAIMQGAGNNLYAKFKLTMAMPQDALDGFLENLSSSPFSYLPAWALYAITCYSYTGKQPPVDRMQFISKHFTKTFQAALSELDNELK